MKDYLLKREILLPQKQEEVFDFFKDAANLELITPPWLNFKILTPLPISMRAGQLIDYRIRLYGLPMPWRTEISIWEPPHRFVDRQLRGPYAKWVHTHTFEASNGGTLMRDTVEYRVPGGWLAAIPQVLFVGRNVERIFDFRTAKIREIFQAEVSID